MKKIIPILDDISSEIMLLELEDLPAIAGLHTQFQSLKEMFSRKKMLKCSALCAKCVDLLNNIMTYDSKVPVEDISEVKAIISVLQRASNEKNDEIANQYKNSDFAQDNGSSKFDTFDSDILKEFINKQISIQEKIEELALALESSFDQEKYNELLRIIHTIKGEAGVLGLPVIEQASHALESLMQDTRENLSCEIILKFKDWLNDIAYSMKNNKMDISNEEILKVINGKGEPVKSASKESEKDKIKIEPSKEDVSDEINLIEDVSFVLDFCSEAKEHLETAENILLKLEAGDTSKDNLNTIFRSFHTIKGVSGFLHLDDISAITHEAENILDKIRKDQLALSHNVLDLLIKVSDKLKLLVGAVETSAKTSSSLKRDSGIAELVGKLQKFQHGEEIADVKIESRTLVPEKESEGPPEKSAQGTSGDDSIRITTDKLDKLINMIGELVISQAMVTQEAGQYHDHSLSKNLEYMRKITRDLQEISMTLRMVPLKSTFLKMSRIVRDVAKKKGKSIDLCVSGEDTELDKTVVDKIGDPLVHMIRNSVDHGIEDDISIRRKHGKSDRGRIELRAFHRGGSIYIEIEDDGKGLDTDAILKKAIQRGLVKEGENISESEIHNFIFEPGFSTAKVITDVSGRGVGMDVVRRNIDSLRGQIDINSIPGEGTTFSIRLPLTLAIIDGMVVRCGKEKYIFPTLSVVTSVRPEAKHISTVKGSNEMYTFQNTLIPILRISKLFEIEESNKDITNSILIIVEDQGKRVAFMTDELLGQQEIVIKSLGTYLKNLNGISGGAILPDGMVGLILDVGGLVKINVI